MALDILAVQGLYGTPLTTELSGGQTFGFNTNIAGPIGRFFDFTANTDPVITIWSAGTGNTLDLSGFDTDSTVDLHPGSFASCDGMVANICIAFDTVIETVIGGKGDDTFTASDVASALIGNQGADTLNGGAAGDTLNGGRNNDSMTGGLGGDTLAGERGADTLIYGDGDESTGASFDTVTGFDFDAMDRFNLAVAVGGIDAKVKSGSLSDATFDADLVFAVGALQLAAGHALLFKPNGGDHAGSTFLIVDENGSAGYQPGDFVMLLGGAKNAAALDTLDFI
jgi:Ca2+-binding RTX toxin-like protein